MPGTLSLKNRLARDIGSSNVLAANRVVLLTATPVLLVLAVLAYLTIQFAADTRENQAQVRHTFQVMEAERRLQDDVQTAETGMRGFLLSRDPAFLQGYRSDVARIPADLQRVRDLTADNPAQQARVARLQRLLQARIAGLEAATVRPTEPVLRTPEAIAGLARGSGQMAAIRAETTAGLTEEARLLAERDQKRLQTETLEIGFAIGGGVLLLGILLIAAAMLVRNNVGLAQAEAARVNEAAILQATLDNARDGLAYFTADGRLSTFNLQFFHFLDLPEGLADSRVYLAQFADTQAAAQDVFRPPTPDESAYSARRIVLGSRELEIYKASVATGGFLIGVIDVTARVRAEAIVRQTQKMEAIGHLTGGVAHDFNNLLQIVSANLDLAAAGDEARANPKLAQRLRNAIAAVARGSRLTGQLLAFARRQALDPRSVDLGRAIRDMSDLLRRSLGEHIQVETVIAGGLWNTMVDPGQMENAILNLAINARDAMPEGGKLTLEVSNAYLDDSYAAEHEDLKPGDYVMLAVSDTGTGMSREVLGRVFEPFFTTKPEGKGTGLGLAQAYGFVKQSGGHIKIYSELGEGTTVKIYLPRTRRPKDDAAAGEREAPEGGSECILVVEDDEGVRAAVVDMLTDLGYRVLRAENAQSALAQLEAGAQVDLLFTDVVMPGPISTREFTKRAQAMNPGLLVLYTSGYTQDAIVHNGRLDDDAVLLSKPYRKDELAHKLRIVLATKARIAVATPPREAPEPNTGQARRKVLVVEDMVLIRMSTVDMLEQLGFEALEAGDGTTALAMLKQDAGIAILLADLGLPGMSGRELVEEAKKLRPALKVIIASGEHVPEAGGMVSLLKPYDFAQLRRALGV